MNRKDDIGKVLDPWLVKAQKILDPPSPSDTRESLHRLEPAQSLAAGDDLTQLNFKIPRNAKKRIKQLAVRDNITLLTMLERMVALYEREYGTIETKR